MTPPHWNPLLRRTKNKNLSLPYPKKGTNRDRVKQKNHAAKKGDDSNLRFDDLAGLTLSICLRSMPAQEVRKRLLQRTGKKSKTEKRSPAKEKQGTFSRSRNAKKGGNCSVNESSPLPNWNYQGTKGGGQENSPRRKKQ